MCLYLSNFLEWIESPYLNCTRTAFLTHTTEEDFARWKNIDLGQLHACLLAIVLVFTNVPNIVVAANDKNFIRFPRHIADTCEWNCPLIEVFILIPHCCLSLQLQIIEVSTSTHVTTGEACIILEPINASDSVDMTFADHVARAVPSVEVENVNCDANRTGE